MSEPTALSIESPKLSGNKIGTATRVDRPFQLGLAPIKLPDGSALPNDAVVGAFVYRVADNGEQIWNSSANGWQTPPADSELGKAIAPAALSFTGASDQPWSTTLNSTPLVDAAGAPLFDIAPKENPKYFARALVSAAQGGVAYRGLSGPSEMLSLARVTNLALSAPQLSWKMVGPWAPVEKPVDIALGNVSLPDGSDATQEDVIKLGVFIYRGTGEIWNEKEQVWQAAPTEVEDLLKLEPLALTYKEGQALPWQGQLTALGQKDKNEAPRFVPINQGGGVYRLRAFAHIKKAGVVYLGLSAVSNDLTFVKTQGEERFKMEFDTDGPQDCTETTIRLRDAADKRTGFVQFKVNPREVVVANCDAAGNTFASIRMTADGDIELKPAAGRRVLMLGDIEAERVRYQPSGGGAKVNL